MLFAKSSLSALLVSLCFSCLVVAQGDFFFTFEPGGQNQDQFKTIDVGDTGSLYIYWSTNGPADSDLDVGAFIDVFTDTPGFVEFTAAETFDYEITVAGVPVFNRLLDVNGGGGHAGPPGNLQPDFIDELSAFTVTGGPGILEANNGSGVFLDSGYDATNDGFMWGRIDFKIISNAPFGGANINITGVAGDGTIVNGPDPIDAVFTTATIHIPGPITPEPTTAGFLTVCLCTVVIRRAR